MRSFQGQLKMTDMIQSIVTDYPYGAAIMSFISELVSDTLNYVEYTNKYK